MGGQLRVYRQRLRTVSTIGKSTRAMELVAASRIMKAQQAAQAAAPYSRELTRAVSAVATYSDVDHPLATEREEPKRAAVLILTSDRGLAGAYATNVLREAERLAELLREEGKEVARYLVGRKAIAYYRFRNREAAGQWSGFTDAPTYANAREVADTLLDAFEVGGDEGGVDEIHIVYTRFVSMLTQRPEVIRLLPLEVVEGEERPGEADLLPLYEFEPSGEEVLNALLPRYVVSRIHACLLQAAASEHASRQRAMKSATDNAKELTQTLQREMNQARQAEITQEISEIVGGASALADAGAER